MPVTDPISDMLTRVRNAIQVRHDSVLVPASKTKRSLARMLQREGFISSVEIEETTDEKKQPMMKLGLKYYEDESPVISGLKRVSRPGLRVYVGRREIPRYYGGIGVSFISTSAGVMTGREAWRRGVGGELLFYVW